MNTFARSLVTGIHGTGIPIITWNRKTEAFSILAIVLVGAARAIIARAGDVLISTAFKRIAFRSCAWIAVVTGGWLTCADFVLITDVFVRTRILIIAWLTRLNRYVGAACSMDTTVLGAGETIGAIIDGSLANGSISADIV